MGRPPITVKSGKLFERQLDRALDWLETNSGGRGGLGLMSFPPQQGQE